VVRDCEEGQFEASGNAGLVKDIRQVALYGFLAECELLGDVPVAAAFYDAADNLELARREAIGLLLRRRGLLHEIVQRGNKIDDALAADPVVTGADGANGGLEMPGESVFEDDAASTDVESLDDLLGRNGRGEQQDLHGGRTLHDGPHGLESRQAWHGDVEQENVRLQFKCLRDRLVAIIGFTDDVESFFRGEHVSYADPNYGMVVRQYDSR
jgi:hypothetical protein